MRVRRSPAWPVVPTARSLDAGACRRRRRWVRMGVRVVGDVRLRTRSRKETMSAPLTRRHGLSELILRVSDVPRAVAFYRDVVGLAVENESSTWAWLWTGKPEALPRLGLTSRPLSYGAAHCGGPAHFAIGIARAAIPAEKARLEGLGIAVEGPITFQSWRADSIYFSDPDDNRVELCGFEHLDGDGPEGRA